MLRSRDMSVGLEGKASYFEEDDFSSLADCDLLFAGLGTNAAFDVETKKKKT